MLPAHKMGEVVLLLERALQLSSKHEERQQRPPPDCFMPLRILQAVAEDPPD